MTLKEAWSIVESKIKDVEPETITELEDFYIFSLRPSGAEPGFSTGGAVVIVNKSNGNAEGASIDDPRLTQGSFFKIIDPSELKGQL